MNDQVNGVYQTMIGIKDMMVLSPVKDIIPFHKKFKMDVILDSIGLNELIILQ
jgi:hypothetical protein